MNEAATETYDDIRAKINSLEEAKKKLIEEIKKLNARLRFKKYEEKKVSARLEGKEKIRAAPYFKMLRKLHFKVSTQAFTAAKEKELVKKIEEIEKKLPAALEVERARKKLKLVKGDIEEAEKRIAEIDEELKKMREELKELYTKLNNLQYSSETNKRKRRRRKRRDKNGKLEEDYEEDEEFDNYMKEVDEFISLEDIAIIEKK